MLTEVSPTLLLDRRDVAAGAGLGRRRRRGVVLLRRGWPFLVPALVLSVVYGCTLQRGTGNAFSLDTTKFEFVGRVLGTPHPPGYPLYTVLNALFVHVVPIGSVALRANLLSAVFAVLACVVTVSVLRELGLPTALQAGGATALGLLPAFWQNAVVAEVYSFTALFLVTVLACLLRYERTSRRWWLRTALLVFALSFAHATSNVLLIPGLLLYLGVRHPWWLLRPRELVTLLPAGALLALGPYAYLPWRTAVATHSWVETRVYDAHSLHAAITGAQFGDRMFELPLELVWDQRVPALAAAATAQLGPLLVCCVLGLVVLARRRPLVAILTAAWAAGTAAFVLTYLVDDWLTLLLPLWLILGLWTLVGLGWCAERAGRRAGVLAVVLAMAVPLGALATGYGSADRSGPDPQRPVDAAVADVPDGSVIFTPTLESRQQFVYRLLPDRLGERRQVYAAEGSNHTTAPNQLVYFLDAYCYPLPGPWAWPWHEQPAAPAVPRGLKTFVFGDRYAEQVGTVGYPATHVQGQLYAIRCGPQAVAIPGGGSVAVPQ